MKDIQILDYLNSDEKVSGTSSSNLSKYMSESVRSEISEFQNQLLFEREGQDYRKKNHEGYHMKLADHEGTKVALFSNSDDPVI